VKVFSRLYDKILYWSRHQHAVYYLAAVAFAEALVFPIPPDIMLVSMGLVKPQKAWIYALVTAVSSIAGGILGYLIGILCFDFIFPYLKLWGYEQTYLLVQGWFHVWGGWTIILASFMPIPFKILAISAGAMQMSFFSFIAAAIIGRGLRFFLVASLMFRLGERLEIVLRKYIDRIGWMVVGVPVICYIGYELAGG